MKTETYRNQGSETNMKSAFRIAYFKLSRHPINPRPASSVLILFPGNPSLLASGHRITGALRCPLFATFGSASMTGGEDNAPEQSPLMEKQFHAFRSQLDDSGSLHERIRAVVMEIESASRLMQASLLLVHQSKPIPQVLEKAKAQIGVLKELYSRLADVLSACPGQYYRYHGDWKSETQTVVSQLAFIHWLETGTLLLHAEAEDRLGLKSSEFDLDVEDYLVGICFLSNEMPRYVVNRVTAGDYDCPRKVLNFMTDLHAAFRMLNLRNDFLRKKFDSLKYDLRKVEEVFYDVKIRGLTPNGESIGNQGIQEQQP